MRIAGLVLAWLMTAPALAATDADHIRNLERDLAPSAMAPGLTPVSLAERMRQLHVPGVSIAYIHDGKIAWARGYGVTRIGGPDVTPDTLFQAGSISKAVTAFGTLKLAEAGIVDLDADVRAYLKRWHIPENDFSRGHAITLRQLLSHTAGMTVHGFSGYAADAPVPSIVQILNGQAPANSPAVISDAVPGGHFAYSGGGYVLAQLALEDRTGKPFAPLMQGTVLAPLGMTHSTFAEILPPDMAHSVAQPYHDWGAVRGGAHRYPEAAAAGLWSTPSDVARFVIALQDAIAGHPGNGGLTQASARQMLAALTPSDKLGITWNGAADDYGLGLLVANAAHPYFWHQGEDAGFLSLMVAYENGDGVVIITNADGGDDLSGDILRTLAREYGWSGFGPVMASSVAAAPLAGYAGIYRTAKGNIRIVSKQGGQLFERHIGVGKTLLLPDGDHAFLASRMAGQDDTARFLFTIGANGKADTLTLRQGDGSSVASRVADTDPDAVWAQDVMARIDTQTVGEGTEAALRHLIGQIGKGTPDYTGMEGSAADVMRTYGTFYHQDALRLGSLRTLTFRAVGPGGNDIYEAHYQNGWAIWRIGLSRQGKIRVAYYEAE